MCCNTYSSVMHIPKPSLSLSFPLHPLVMDSDWDTCSLAFQEMNKLLCFWAPLPIPESQRLIAAHRAPLRSLQSKNSPLTHTHTCMDTSLPSPTDPPNHPLTHTYTNTPFCPLPFPKPIMCWPVLKNLCSNGSGSKAISCVLQPPHLQIPTHRNTEGSLCAAGCYFYPHCGGQSRGEGRTQGVKAFQWLQAWT